MGTKTKAHIAVLLANFFFGSGVVAVKHITPSLVQPLALNFIRSVVALVLFWLLFFIKPSNVGIRKKDIPLFLICATCGVIINQILFIKGTSLTSPIHASLLSLVTPIVITIIAIAFLKEKLSWNKLTGLCLGISGACILILLKKFDTEKGSSMLGDSFIIINAASYATYLVLAKPLMEQYKPIHVTRWIFLLGAIVILPLGWNDFTQIAWATFDWTHWLALIFVALGATFFAYLFIVYGIAHLGSSVVGSYIYTQPIFATLSAMILFGEKLSAVKIVAAVLIFGGVYLVNFKRKLSIPEAMESMD